MNWDDIGEHFVALAACVALTLTFWFFEITFIGG